MYETPKLQRLGSFRELTQDDTKVVCTADIMLNLGAANCDGYRS